MNPFKLICLDIDGTLLDANRSLSERTKAVFRQLDPSVVVILCSSRMPSAMRYLQEGLGVEGYPLICYNGGLIIDEHGTVLDNQSIPMECLSVIKEHDFAAKCNISLYHDGDWFTDQADYWTNREINNTRVEPTLRPFAVSYDAFVATDSTPQKIMCMGDNKIIDTIVGALDANDIDVNHYRSKDTYLEISARTTNKALALDQLIKLKFPKIQSSEVIAFGDNYNDIDLIQYAGCGVAMGNGRDALKAVADRVAAKNVDDGVALVVEEVFVEIT